MMSVDPVWRPRSPLRFAFAFLLASATFQLLCLEYGRLSSVTVDEFAHIPAAGRLHHKS